jgi:hypothetical protein
VGSVSGGSGRAGGSAIRGQSSPSGKQVRSVTLHRGPPKVHIPDLTRQIGAVAVQCRLARKNAPCGASSVTLVPFTIPTIRGG